jgi:sugar phosphate isomerase/epimerase
MGVLLSLNNKVFSKYDSRNLVGNIMELDVNKVVDGAELYIDMTNEKERKYGLEITEKMKENKWIVQVHSVCMFGLEENQINEYLEYYNEIALIYGENIKLTIHPAEEIKKEDSIIKTIDVISYITKYIKEKNLKLDVLIENLNEYRGKLRCNIFEIYDIMDKLQTIDKDIGITFDIGHYIYDYVNDYKKLYKYTDKIQNMHIHDIDNKRIEHSPFYYGNVDIEKMVKYIKSINYKENIVLEIGVEYFSNEIFEGKLSEYIKQIEYIKTNISNTIIKTKKIKKLKGAK